MKRFVFSSVVAFGAACVYQNGYAEEPKSVPAPAIASTMLQSVRNLPHNPFIRILLASQKNSFQVEVQGAHNIYDPFTGKKLEAAFLSSSYQMVPTADGIKWGQEFPGVYQILVVPDSQSGTVTVDGIQYSGAVAFYEVCSVLAAVNWVSLEDATSSLLSMMMAPANGDHKEALAAMAIGVRTLALEQLAHPSNHFWDVRADACGYKGRAVVRLDEPFQDAIRVSRNIVLEPKQDKSGSFISQDLDRLKQMINYQQAIDLAQNGKDAAYIIEKAIPGRQLVSVSKN